MTFRLSRPRSGACDESRVASGGRGGRILSTAMRGIHTSQVGRANRNGCGDSLLIVPARRIGNDVSFSRRRDLRARVMYEVLQSGQF